MATKMKKYDNGGVYTQTLPEVTVTAKKKKKYNNGGAANSKVRPVDDKTTKQAAKPTYKTGGMVNANSKVSALTSAGSKGVKSGVNTKTRKQTKPKGKVGGISTAPKGAIPKSKMGGAKKAC